MKIKKEENHLVIRLSLVEKILSVHGDFKIPESSIVSIEEREPEWGFWDLKFPGSYFPGIIRAGTYLTNRGREFWYWTSGKKHRYVIELTDSFYKRIILATDDTMTS